MKTIITFLIKHLFVIHQGTLIAKAKSTVSIAMAISPIAYITEQITHWSLNNSTYVLYVFGAIIIDHLLGSIIHTFIDRDFSFKKNVLGLVTKIGLVVAVGFLFEVVNEIVKEASFVKDYLMIVLRLAVFLYPAGSAFMNSAIITDGKFPPIGLINKFKKFQENANLKDIKNETT